MKSILWPRNGLVSFPLDVAGLDNVHHHVHGLVSAAGLAEHRRRASADEAVETNALTIDGHAIDVRRCGGIAAFRGRHCGDWRYRWSGLRCCGFAAPLRLRHGQSAEHVQRVRSSQALQVGYVELALQMK